MGFLRRGVWQSPHFFSLWAGQATSMFGSLVGGFAYSLVAIITLHATPPQIAILNGCSLIPALLAGPWVGVWTDRLRRRPLLMTADLGRAAILVSIPIAALTHTLTLPQLYIVAIVVSVLRILFDVPFRAYVPGVVPPEVLVEANSVLRGTEAVAEASGFALGGLLVQLVTAPVAIAIDAVSFLVSAASLSAIRRPEARVIQGSELAHRPHSLVEIRDGIRTVWKNPILRALTLTAFAWDLAGNAIGVVIMLFFIRDLHLTPLEMGPVFAVGGVSALLGALLAPRILTWWGVGRSLIGSLYVNNLGLLVVAIAGGPLPLVLFLLALEQMTDSGRSVYDIHTVSLLQTYTPEGLVGRVFATYETARSVGLLLGLVGGGVLGGLLGLRTVLILGFAANMFVPLCLIFSPLRGMKRITTLEDRNRLQPESVPL